MFDFSFFALLFLLASSLAPDGSRSIVLENTRYPEQTMTWTRGSDGRWAMTINGRDLGFFERTADAIVHATGQRDPDRFAIVDLADAADLTRTATSIRLLGRWSPRIVSVAPEGDTRILSDDSRELLRTPLRLRARR
jgi:hypothetical protein